jgi:hypothetical protein
MIGIACKKDAQLAEVFGLMRVEYTWMMTDTVKQSGSLS